MRKRSLKVSTLLGIRAWKKITTIFPGKTLIVADIFYEVDPDYFVKKGDPEIVEARNIFNDDFRQSTSVCKQSPKQANYSPVLYVKGTNCLEKDM